MAIKKPKIKLYADPRKQPEDTYLIQVQISYGGRAYVSTDMKFNLTQWKIIQDHNITSSKEHGFTTKKLKEIRSELAAFEDRADEVTEYFIKKNLPFTASMIRDAYYDFTPSSLHQLSVYHLFTAVYKAKLDNGKSYKTCESYLNSRSAFLKFKKYLIEKAKNKKLNDADMEMLKDSFSIIEVDAKFIREFESIMLNPPIDSGLNRISFATIQSYIINMRAVFNHCITKGILTEEIYPFNKKHTNNYYRIRPSQRTKKALSEEEIKKLIAIRPTLSDAQKRALDFFMFSILTNGANLIDIAQFKYNNVDRDANVLTFVRQKTENTAERRKEIPIELTQLHNSIMKQYSSNDPTNDYIFNLLDGLMSYTNKEISKSIAYRLRNFKKAYKIISKKAGIREFTYTFARHTFATIGVMKIGDIFIVGEGMGHAIRQTTENYTATLPIKEENKLTNMKSELLSGYIINSTDE